MTAPHSLETLRLPERVYQDIATYRSGVCRFQSGELSEVAFRAFRVPMGVYEHRQTGHYMVRVRLGAGLALPVQLERIAALAVEHGDGILHVTTRQDIQIHHVSLEGTIAVQEGLIEAGLSARGGGGNTVRNVTACPRAMVCPKAVFDVTPHALGTAEHLLQIPRSYNLPRKYKIAFSGCPEDCAFASVNDLGFFAHERDGKPGFAVYAGGGLGPQASAAVLIEELVPPEEVYLVAETVERLFDRLGDRANKHQARLRYVLRRLGPTAFVSEYRKEREATAREGLSAPAPTLRRFPQATPGKQTTDSLPDMRIPDGFLAERDPGRFTLRLQLHNGQIPAADLIKVAHLARDVGGGLVAASQQQDLLVLGIPATCVADARAVLAGLSIDTRPGRPKVVACAGASTCKLGICLSPALADAIAVRVGAAAPPSGFATIRVSGCPNACGNHAVTGFGLEGCARRHGERLLPLYEVLVGGQTKEGDVRHAERLGAVPARVVPELVAQVQEQHLQTADEIRPLVARFARLPEPVPEDFYVDHGSREPFSLAGRGPGECGAGVLDIVRADLQEGADALAAADQSTRERSAHVRRAITAAATALLPLFGIEARKDREVFEAATANLIVPGWVAVETGALFAAVLDWRLGDRATLDDLVPQTRQFLQRVRELFASLDGNLRFRLQPLVPAGTTDQAPPAPHRRIDLRGVACPMNFVKAKVALERIPVGEMLEVLLDGGDPVRNVPASFADQGQEVLEVAADGGHFRVRVKRAK